MHASDPRTKNMVCMPTWYKRVVRKLVPPFYFLFFLYKKGGRSVTSPSWARIKEKLSQRDSLHMRRIELKTLLRSPITFAQHIWPSPFNFPLDQTHLGRISASFKIQGIDEKDFLSPHLSIGFGGLFTSKQNH